MKGRSKLHREVKEHYDEYDVLRVIATLLVLLGHCTYLIISSDYGGVDYEKYIDSNIPVLHRALSALVSVIYTFHMPLFTALGGALFCLSIRSINGMKDLARKKFSRLIIPFLAVSLFYSVPIKYLSGYFQSTGTLAHDIFLGQILLQGNSHLWFLEALFLISSSSICLKILAGKIWTKTFSVVSFILDQFFYTDFIDKISVSIRSLVLHNVN